MLEIFLRLFVGFCSFCSVRMLLVVETFGENIFLKFDKLLWGWVPRGEVKCLYCWGLCHDASDASSRVPLCLNTENSVSEETMNQFNTALLASRLDNHHTPENTEKKQKHLSGFWTAPFWRTSFLGNRRIIKNSKILWKAVPSNRSPIRIRLVDDGGRETSSSFNPLPWLQPLTGRTTNILWLWK